MTNAKLQVESVLLRPIFHCAIPAPHPGHALGRCKGRITLVRSALVDKRREYPTVPSLSARCHPSQGVHTAVRPIPRNSGKAHLNCFADLDLPACYPRSMSTGKVINFVWASPKSIRPDILFGPTQQCSNRRGQSCQIESQAVACAAGHNLKQIANP